MIQFYQYKYSIAGSVNGRISFGENNFKKVVDIVYKNTYGATMNLTLHFNTHQGLPIERFRPVISRTCKDFINWQESRLNAKCTQVFWQRNRLDEDQLYGKFCHNRKSTIISLAYYVPYVGWITYRKELIEAKFAHNPFSSED